MLISKTFETLAESGCVERVCIYRPSHGAPWEVHVYSQGMPLDEKGVIELEGNGGTRSWRDIDAAYAFIRRAGYKQMIEIDETTWR